MAVNKFYEGDQGRHLRPAVIKERFSKTIGHSYISFGCPACDALSGDWFVDEAIMEARYQQDDAPAILQTEIEFTQPIIIEYPHWCFPKHQDYCDQ
jgi:hypothetical protein